MEEKDLLNIPKEKFTLVRGNEEIHDLKFETKPVSFLKGCWNRFRKNNSSVVAGVIILLIALFAIIVPSVSPVSVAFKDQYFKNVLPKIAENANGFWDGTETASVADAEYLFSSFRDTDRKFLIEELSREKVAAAIVGGSPKTMHKIRRDTYAVGAVSNKTVTFTEYEDILKYEKENKINILIPLTDTSDYADTYLTRLENEGYNISNISSNLRTILNSKFTDSNVYYEVEFIIKKNGTINNQAVPSIYDENDNKIDISTMFNTSNVAEYDKILAQVEKGHVKPLYSKYASSSEVYAKYKTDKDLNIYNTPVHNEVEGDQEIRVDYYNYFKYVNGFEAKYLFGANVLGQDIFVRLASGAQLSLALGVFVTLINVIIGICYGAIAGYYGGRIDLLMERFTDILSAIPFVIVVTLFNLHLKDVVGPLPSLLFAFVLTGWIGVAGTTRMQFYRFKDQEYVLASRTLGARDGRLIFKHILPNAAGTLITSCILMIPSVIFSESSLSYLGILDLSLSNITSVGTLLNEGSSQVKDYPHMVLFPAIFISILMICFNLFGNGLRDAFNPTLRGSEE